MGRVDADLGALFRPPGIVTSLPLGIPVALGRRSNLPVIQLLSIGWHHRVHAPGVRYWVLFMATEFVFPLFLPEGINFNEDSWAMVGVTLFSARIYRGGHPRWVQAVCKGQYKGPCTGP